MEEGAYTLNSDDILAANRLHSTRAFRWKRAAAALALVTFCWSVWLWASFPCLGVIAYAAVPLVAVGLYCLMWLVGWMLLVPMAKRTWTQSQKMWVEQHVRCTPEQIEFSSERGDVRFKWTDFYRWSADEKVLLLYQTARSYITVPLRSFGPDSAIRIRGVLQAAGVQER